MKFGKTLLLLIGAGLLAGSGLAQPAPPHENYGTDKTSHRLAHIEIHNLRGERLGRIQELGIDLTSGRIVEVLVVSGDFLGFGGKIVAVPPAALIPDDHNAVFWLNVSADYFKASPVIDLAKWENEGRSDKVADAYRRFGREPFFLEDGRPAAVVDDHALVRLGYVERSSQVIGKRVHNRQGEILGKVWRLKLDLAAGRILGVIIEEAGKLKTKRLVPAMALTFTPDHHSLVLDDTVTEFANEPSYHSTTAANGQKEHHKEESYVGPRTSVALEQGSSARDRDRTLIIYRNIRAARLRAGDVEIGTLNGRVTLRGSVRTEEDRQRVKQIAVAASLLELVDDQLVVVPQSN